MIRQGSPTSSRQGTTARIGRGLLINCSKRLHREPLKLESLYVPITYTIDEISGLVISVATGVVDLQTYETYLEKRNNDRLYNAKMNGLFDARRVRFAFTDDDIRYLIKLTKKQASPSNSRRAIVTREDLEP